MGLHIAMISKHGWHRYLFQRSTATFYSRSLEANFEIPTRLVINYSSICLSFSHCILWIKQLTFHWSRNSHCCFSRTTTSTFHIFTDRQEAFLLWGKNMILYLEMEHSFSFKMRPFIKSLQMHGNAARYSIVTIMIGNVSQIRRFNAQPLDGQSSAQVKKAMNITRWRDDSEDTNNAV